MLIADDDPMVRQINAAYVAKVPGFCVVGEAGSGEEAVAAAQALRPDLVLLDVYMARGDGVAALKRLRSLDLPTDVLVISAAQDAQTIQEMLRYGAVDYIIKPFQFRRLKQALEEFRASKLRLSAGTLSQEQLDRMLRGGAAGAAAAGPEPELPKGLNARTLAQVEALLAQAPAPLTAAEAAAALGLARATARRYLEFLAQAGRARLEVQYGTIGRPLNRYSAAGGRRP